MRQGFFALLTADPLRGALRPVEARLLEEARGQALFLVPYPLRDLAEAWRLAYQSLGLRQGRLLYLRRREEAFDPEVARSVAASPLVLLAAEGLPEFLDLIRGSLVLQALLEVHRQGGGVVALGEAAGLLGEAAFYPLEGEVRAALGLALLRGLALLPRVEERGRFLALSRLVADNPDLVGLGLRENTALRLLRGLGEVWAGEVTLVDAGGAEFTARGVKGLRVDVLAAGERFPLPAL
ncbi:cyanophycinase [Thermus sp.]|uniref:cyanophycinase n=1 Tax=Thermus sp. TaxID=275 RepID=UPI0025F632CC|nr:cyanophycinase [Thermus sp.]MCS6869124.1 cyanophycinase [Thermus sp.]MCX7849637.1 cyanophycinase [Thermus sp.]MDW8356565.1 cyanophycinase [Thermus sp.]